MHAPLGVPHRQEVCHDFIRALQECHAKGAWYKFIGGCNDEKLALNMCLRRERVERTDRNREASKERNRKKHEAWEKLAAERRAAGEEVPERPSP